MGPTPSILGALEPPSASTPLQSSPWDVLLNPCPNPPVSSFTPEHYPALNPVAKPFLSGMRFLMHSPVSPLCTSEHRRPSTAALSQPLEPCSNPNRPFRYALLDIARPQPRCTTKPFLSKLRSSMHAPGSPPTHTSGHRTAFRTN